MLHGVFLDNSIKSTACYNHGPGVVHSCPFCRCRSVDSSINMYFLPQVRKIFTKPSSSFTILLGKDFIQKKIKYSKIDEASQKVYYRSFESPRKRGLSPNGSKKIVIQYSSPQPTLQNSRTFKSFFEPVSIQSSNKASFIVSSPVKTSPRNIYTNENTPPKAKFLQKKSSRKNSEDKMQPTTVKGLVLVESERVRKPFVQPQQNAFAPYFSKHFTSYMNTKPQQQKIAKFGQSQNYEYKQKENQVSPIGRISYLDSIPQTSTKNIIQRASSPQNSASPFNSLVDSTPQVFPYGSFSSTPIMPNDESERKRLTASIRQVGEFKQQEPEPKFYKKSSEPVESNRIQLTPKSIELTPRGDRYSHERFDKTLGKPKSAQHQHQPQNNENNDLIYSEQSDKQTQVNNPPGSQRNIFHFPAPQHDLYSKSEQNIRPHSEHMNVFEKKRGHFDAVEISDNFETPKSKYKTMRTEEGWRNPNVHINMKKTSGIKFTTLADNKKSKTSNNGNNDMIMKGKSSHQEGQPSTQNNNDKNQSIINNVVQVQAQGQMNEQQQGEDQRIHSHDPEDQRIYQHQRSVQMPKYMSESSSRSSLSSASRIKMRGRQLVFDESKSRHNESVSDPELEPQLGVSAPSNKDFSRSNLHAAELNEELKLNYDYYVLEPWKGQFKGSSQKNENNADKEPNREKNKGRNIIQVGDDGKVRQTYEQAQAQGLKHKEGQQLEESPYYHYQLNSFQQTQSRPNVSSFAKDSSASESGEVDITF